MAIKMDKESDEERFALLVTIETDPEKMEEIDNRLEELKEEVFPPTFSKEEKKKRKK